MRERQPDESRSQIDDFLNDPIVQKVMHADKVDTSALLALLARAARKLKERYPEIYHRRSGHSGAPSAARYRNIDRASASC